MAGVDIARTYITPSDRAGVAINISPSSLSLPTGRVDVVRGMVQKNVETLMRWAARDNDRPMLYGAELSITLTP